MQYQDLGLLQWPRHLIARELEGTRHVLEGAMLGQLYTDINESPLGPRNQRKSSRTGWIPGNTTNASGGERRHEQQNATNAVNPTGASSDPVIVV